MKFKLYRFDKQAFVIITVFAAILVLYYYFVTLPAQRKFERYARYTIGEVRKTESPTRGSCWVYYDYRVNGKWYIGSSIIEGCGDLKLYVSGRRIFMKFSSLHPNENEFLDRQFAPDSLVPPENGWKVLPILNRQ
jgi:hypothetical protein